MYYISIYLLFGAIWLAFIEYTSTRLNLGPAWTNRERITQVLIWPIALFTFIKFLIENRE